MAKKLKIFSELGLAVLTVLCLGFAIKFNQAYACGSDGDELTNCVEEEPSLISPNPAEVSSDDVYGAADGTLNSSRSVRHSLFLAGNDVTSNDVVDGINFIAGNLVNFAGSAEYAAVAGNTIKISGSIERDLFAAGNSIELGEDAYLGRDVYAAASIVTVKTNLYGNVFLGGSRIVLENVTITGDLNVAADEIVIKGKSAVAGTFNHNDNAKITGLENLSAGQTTTYAGGDTEVSFATSFSDKLLSFLSGLLLTVVLIALMPKFAKKLLDTFRWSTSWKHLALGLALLVVVPVAAIFVAITILGLQLGLLTLGLYFTFICVASSVTGGIVGDQLATAVFKKPKMNLYAKYVLGFTVLFVLSLIPVVGGLVEAISLCFGFGYLSKRLFIRK